MAETQKVKIARLEKELQEQVRLTKRAQEEANQLYEKLGQLQDSADSQFSASPYFHQLNNENKLLRDRVGTLENRLKQAQKKHDAQVGLIEAGMIKQHNARGAGRKPKFKQGQIQHILELRESGKSMASIAKEMGCSVGLIHKLIVENK